MSSSDAGKWSLALNPCAGETRPLVPTIGPGRRRLVTLRSRGALHQSLEVEPTMSVRASSIES